eukprot:CCRYP_019766-RA/>CCRYP_019766-RA protein AED:0.40 eAED:0.40 QI:0/0/0/1/0/0.33/3/0/291
MESSNEFTVRITGTSPPPIATKKSKRQNTASAPTQQRFNLRLSSSTTLNRLQADVFSLFNVPASNRKAYRMEFLSGFPPIVLDQNGKNNVGELGIRSSENVIVKITLISSDDNASATQSEKADDIATTLLSSLGNKSIGGGNVGKFLRAAMKGALTKSYEASKAQVRVSAVENRDYEFGKIKGGSIVDGGVVLGTSNDDTNDMVRNDILGTSMYQVSYGKGMEGRGKFVEQVEIIGVDALKAVIETVYKSESVSDEANDEIEEKGKSEGREMLRPASIAQMSPRIFWSLNE